MCTVTDPRPDNIGHFTPLPDNFAFEFLYQQYGSKTRVWIISEHCGVTFLSLTQLPDGSLVPWGIT